MGGYLFNPLLKRGFQDDWRFEDDYDVYSEHFEGAVTGSRIQFTSASTGGAVNSTSNEDRVNWGGTTQYHRFGVASLGINTVINSRASLAIRSGGFNRFIFNQPSISWFIEAEVSYNGGQINFTLDPTLDVVGFISDFTIANPLIGVYFRRPRTSETAFLKYVVRQAGVETIFDTTIPYDSIDDRYIKVGFFCDGSNLILRAKNDNLFWTTTIVNFTATYPTIIGLPFGFYMGRNGFPITPNNRGIRVDAVRMGIKHISPFEPFLS